MSPYLPKRPTMLHIFKQKQDEQDRKRQDMQDDITVYIPIFFSKIHQKINRTNFIILHILPRSDPAHPVFAFDQ
jgi:hypothetical protein